MRGARQVQPDPVRRRDRDDRRPAANAQQREVVEQRRVGLRLRHAEIEIGNERTSVRCRHADMDAQRSCRRTSRNDLVAAADLADERQRGSHDLRCIARLLRYH